MTAQRSHPHPKPVALSSGGNIKAKRYTIDGTGDTVQTPGKLSNVIFRAPTSNDGNVKINFGADVDADFFLLEPGDVLPVIQIRSDKNIKLRKTGPSDQVLMAIYWE